MSNRKDLTCLIAMIDRQLQRKKSLEARERALEQQLEKWRRLLNQRMAIDNAKCPHACQYPETPRRGSSRPKSSHGQRASGGLDSMLCPAMRPATSNSGCYCPPPQWSPCPPPPPPPPKVLCLCSTDSRDTNLNRIRELADEEIQLMTDIEATEARIMSTCNAICALKQVFGLDGQPAAAGPSTEPSPAPAPSADEPSPAPAPAEEGGAEEPCEMPETPVPETSPEAESVPSKIASIQDNLDNVEAAVLSSHTSQETPSDDRRESTVSYRDPEAVTAYWNEVDATKRRLSLLVKHSQACKTCEDTFQDTFTHINEELDALAEELRKQHTNVEDA